jgi:ABC-type multidrug transport system ATPase subunit
MLEAAQRFTSSAIEALYSLVQSVGWFGLLAVAAGAIALAYQAYAVRRSRKRVGELTATLSTERERLNKLQTKVPSEPAPYPPQTEGKVPELPEELVQAAAANEVVLVMGAGCSAQASLPASTSFWLDVLEAVSGELDANAQEILGDAITRGDKSALETLLAAVGRERLIEAARKILALPEPVSLPDLHQSLAEGNWSAIVGLTWDELDLLTFEKRGFTVVRAGDSERLPELLRSSQPVLIKPIGDLQRPETIALTWQDYREVLERWPDLVRGLATLFTTRTLLFVGASLDTIEQFLNSLPSRITPQRTHYALVPEARINSVWKKGIGARFQIQLVEMVVSPGFPEVPAFIENLVEKAPRTRAGRMANTATPRAPNLTRLRLENVGLFEKLDLHFTEGWTILLGINGGGKSTVLKAIGLALCGDEARAEAAAQRMLRSGTSSGLIELHLGNERLVTELTRERDRIRVSSPPITPVQAGTILALGFPALRGVTTRGPTGYAALSRPDPSPQDILPLVSEPYDQRLDNFMQWAINVKIAADRDPRGPDAALLRVLETLIGEIIPPCPLRFVLETIGPGRFELRVAIAETVVPFDLISQGMSSIFNWLGVLLQRLHDVYPTASGGPDPQNHPALVLVDEIDAHLHPEWQRRLVDLVRKHFPNVQVIATSHSPLIVGALTRQEVRLIHNGQAIDLPEDLKGKNAEDILTSAAFRMSSTRADSGRDEIERYFYLYGKTDRTEEENQQFAALSKRFGELRYGTSAREERVRKAVYAALQAEGQQAQKIDPELRLLIERELGTTPIRPKLDVSDVIVTTDTSKGGTP